MKVPQTYGYSLTIDGVEHEIYWRKI